MGIRCCLFLVEEIIWNVFYKNTKMKKIFCLALYYGLAYYLPNSYKWGIIGTISNSFRVALCKRIFKKSGNISVINRCVDFASGRDIEIGDDSGIGEHVQIPNNTIIGNYVMLGRYTFVLDRNHEYADVTIPINKQGFKDTKQLIIEDDCWIGAFTKMTPGRYIKKGTIIAMGTLLCKDFPEYSVVGGNPSKLIKSRIG